jgi:hypothetical protein
LYWDELSRKLIGLRPAAVGVWAVPSELITVKSSTSGNGLVVENPRRAT